MRLPQTNKQTNKLSSPKDSPEVSLPVLGDSMYDAMSSHLRDAGEVTTCRLDSKEFTHQSEGTNRNEQISTALQAGSQVRLNPSLDV